MQRIAVLLRGVDRVRVVEADRMDYEGLYLVLRLGNDVVARIRADELRDWWIDTSPGTPSGCP
jgi:hypothetical protein